MALAQGAGLAEFSEDIFVGHEVAGYLLPPSSEKPP